MEGEINNFIKIWLQVIPSLCYCYLIGKLLPKGIPRLFAILPIVLLFLALPLALHSVHLGGFLSFFIAWLANFKLLLFAFGKGPLSDPSLSLKRFVAVASSPIKIDHNENHPPNGTTNQSKENPSQKKGQKSVSNYAIKGLLLAGVVSSYAYSDSLHPNLLLALYSLHTYLCLEIVLVMVATMARNLLGIELEPQFDEPYLSSSLQDFWGRRWNIMVPKILRPTVYEPAYRVALRFMGRKWAYLPAVFATFLVSGFMHELIIYYMGRLRPTWEITWFFLLHGFCLVVEIGLKKKLNGKFRLPRVISGPLAVGFVMVTACWLFFPQLLRCNSPERALQEVAAVGVFVKSFRPPLTFNASRSLQMIKI